MDARSSRRARALALPAVALAAVALLASAAVGCGQRPMPAGYAGDDVRAFAKRHRAELQQEADVGSGRHLYALAVTAECQDVTALGRLLHKRRERVFWDESANAPASDEAVADRLVTWLADTPQLRCQGLDLSRPSQQSAGLQHVGPSRGQVRLRGAP